MFTVPGTLEITRAGADWRVPFTSPDPLPDVGPELTETMRRNLKAHLHTVAAWQSYQKALANVHKARQKVEALEAEQKTIQAEREREDCTEDGWAAKFIAREHQNRQALDIAQQELEAVQEVARRHEGPAKKAAHSMASRVLREIQVAYEGRATELASRLSNAAGRIVQEAVDNRLRLFYIAENHAGLLGMADGLI